MPDPSFTPEIRAELLATYRESRKQTSWPIYQTLSAEQSKKERRLQDRLLAEYAARLPAVPLSRCPFCETIVEYVMDPMGLDGPWWFVDKLIDYPTTDEEHFRVLLGAIDFHGREPAEARVHHTVLPGPGVPYVVPALFDTPDMQAVISTIPLANGDQAYVTAYFSPAPVHGGMLHQPWARGSYEVFDEGGEYEAWTIKNDQWDFELQPWVDKGVLSWIEPGDDSLTLRREGECPFDKLPGVRAQQHIQLGQMSHRDVPDGKHFSPFEKPNLTQSEGGG